MRTGRTARSIAEFREAIDAAVARAAEAGEGGEAYGHIAELLRLSPSASRRQRSGGRRRLRGPPAPRRRPARAGGDRQRLPRPLQPPHGRRVPGHQPAAAAPDRGAARAGHRADGRRR